MLRVLIRHSDWVLLTALVVASFTLMTISVHRQGRATLIERSVLQLIAPLQTLTQKPSGQLTKLRRHYGELLVAKEQLESYRQELETLRRKLSDYAEMELRYRRLKKLLSFKEASDYETVAAQVVGRDATNWSKTIIINRGGSEGLTRDMPVITHAGVVGRIIETAPNASKVLLISDYRSAVDGLVQRSRAPAVFVAKGNGLGELKYLPAHADVRVGDVFISSGLGGGFPKGLVVGDVIRVEEERKGLFKIAEVKPRADLSSLEEVLVITGRKSSP